MMTHIAKLSTLTHPLWTNLKTTTWTNILSSSAPTKQICISYHSQAKAEQRQKTLLKHQPKSFKSYYHWGWEGFSTKWLKMSNQPFWGEAIFLMGGDIKWSYWWWEGKKETNLYLQGWFWKGLRLREVGVSLLHDEKDEFRWDMKLIVFFCNGICWLFDIYWIALF